VSHSQGDEGAPPLSHLIVFERGEADERAEDRTDRGQSKQTAETNEDARK